MEPEIKTGSVVFVQKINPETLKKDDVITYASAEDTDILITHRLVAIEEKEGKTIFKTQGDANNSEDVGEISSSQIKGKVVFSLPLLGYLSVWIREPKGFGLLVVLPALLIIISEILNIKKTIEEEVEKKYKNKNKESKKGIKIKTILLFLFLTPSLVGLRAHPTNAYFSDTLVSSGNTFSTGWWADTEAPISGIDQEVLYNFQNSTNFSINYFSDDGADGSGVKEVSLYYSYNLDNWVLFGEISIPDESGNGLFNFTSPLGDGLYDFQTIAVDNAGNTEEKDVAVVDASTQVDTEAPYTNLSLGEFGDDYIVGNRFAVNEQMVNGNFEDTNNSGKGWVWEGDGEHRVVDNADLGLEAEVKAGDNSALIGWLDIGPTSDGTDYLYQTVSVPDTSSTLSFWYRVLSDDIVEYDYFEAKVVDAGGTQADEIIIQTGSDESGIDRWWGDSLWQEITYSLDNWLNSTVNLWFGVINGDEAGWPRLKTAALIDDVRVTNSDNFVTTDKEIAVESNDTGSGIETTWYRINGGVWQEYEGVFDLSDVEVASGSNAVIDYYSVDLAGNIRATKSASLVADDSRDYFGVVLNGIMPHPNDTDPVLPAKCQGEEWVELFNLSDVAVDVAGWEVNDLYKYSGGTRAEVAETENRVSLNSGNSVNDGTMIAPNSSLIFCDSFDLNNTGGTSEDDRIDGVRLFAIPGGSLVDSFSYQWVLKGKPWRRVPDGTGTWADPEEKKEIEVGITSVGGTKIILSIFNIPENYGENGNLFEYEIIYIGEGNLEKGIAGQILPEAVKSNRANQELYLGTCSAEGACIPDIIKDGVIYLTIIQGQTTVVDNRQFKI